MPSWKDKLDNEEAAFWERWYELAGHYHFGPAVTVYVDPKINERIRKESQAIYEKYKNASDDVLKEYRKQNPYYPCQ